MSILYLEAGINHLCDKGKKGIKVLPKDNLISLRLRAMGAYFSCTGDNSKCSKDCDLIKLREQLEVAQTMEPVVVVSRFYAKLFRTGKLVRLRRVY